MDSRDGSGVLPAEGKAPETTPASGGFRRRKHIPWKQRPLWVRATLWCLGVLCALVILLLSFRDILMLQAIRHWGSALTGTKVELKNFLTSLSGLNVLVEGLSVANPPGYHSPAILELERLYVDVDETTAFSDMIVVDCAEIRGFHVNYERKVSGSNFDDLQDNIEDFIDSRGGVPEETPAAEEEKGKDLLIRRLEISGNSITVYNPETGLTFTVPMGNLTLQNIGGRGCSVSEVLNDVFARIGKLVAGSLPGVGGYVSAGENDAVDLLKNAGQKTVDAGNNAVDLLKNAGQKTVDALDSLWKK